MGGKITEDTRENGDNDRATSRGHQLGRPTSQQRPAVSPPWLLPPRKSPPLITQTAAKPQWPARNSHACYFGMKLQEFTLILMTFHKLSL